MVLSKVYTHLLPVGPAGSLGLYEEAVHSSNHSFVCFLSYPIITDRKWEFVNLWPLESAPSLWITTYSLAALS